MSPKVYPNMSNCNSLTDLVVALISWMYHRVCFRDMKLCIMNQYLSFPP